MHRLLCLVVAAATAAPQLAEGQVFQPQSQPSAWLSFGVGTYNAGEVAHGPSGASWDFGNRTSLQYRVTLEQALRNNISLGVDGGYVRAPITLRPFDTPAIGTPADVDVYSLHAKFHAGGGPGFHQVVNAGLGVVSYQNFRRDSDSERLEPRSPERTFGFVFGYGFGYSLSQRGQVNLVQEYGFNLHSSRDTPSGASNTLRFYSTRLTYRMGLGGGPPVRRR